MTPVLDPTAIDRTEPGWLRRAWQAGLTERVQADVGELGTRSGFLLHADIPEILEPFIKAEPAPGLDEGDLRILDFDGLDGPAAAALLAALASHAPELDLGGYAPPATLILRAVADNPDRMLAGGSVIGPELPGEAICVRELTILDPGLADVPPDVLPGELPSWIDELPAEDYAAYLASRRACLEHAVTRQAWVTAVARYDIREARRFPDMRLLTDDESGTSRGVWFAW